MLSCVIYDQYDLKNKGELSWVEQEVQGWSELAPDHQS